MYNDLDEKSYFNQLYDTYHQVVFVYILSHVNHRETAKDLLQDTYLRIWNQIHVGYEMGLSQSRFWIYRIAKNLIVDYYRRRATIHKVQEKVRAEAAVETYQSAEDAFESIAHVRHIEAAIQALPEGLRTVLVMHLVGHMDSKKIGEILDIPAGTVRYRLSMARRQLREQIAQSPGEEIRL
jgi:RNA polymerase sigma-70 factor (ECF subfamily)